MKLNRLILGFIATTVLVGCVLAENKFTKFECLKDNRLYLETKDDCARIVGNIIGPQKQKKFYDVSGEIYDLQAYYRSRGLDSNGQPLAPSTVVRLPQKGKQQTAKIQTPLKSNNESLQKETRPVATTASHRRIALVIGNANYKSLSLKNPNNDASDMARTLVSIGFKVTTHFNANNEEMENALQSFSSKINDGDAVLFYYAGHGVQYKGENYLLPINSIDQISSGRELATYSIPLNKVLNQIGERRNPLNIVILDACRQSPFEMQTEIASGLARGILVRIKDVNPSAPVTEQNLAGTLIAYATAPNKVALDGNGRNSPYTKSLLKHLTEPNISIEQVLKQTTVEVSSTTNGMQIPWYESSIGANFFPYGVSN